MRSLDQVPTTTDRIKSSTTPIERSLSLSFQIAHDILYVSLTHQPNMRSTLLTGLIAGLLSQQAAAHATFQALWVDGADYGSQCARVPPSNSPVTDVTSNAMRCNAGTSPVAKKCPVKAGSMVTVEMHQVCCQSPTLVNRRLRP